MRRRTILRSRSMTDKEEVQGLLVTDLSPLNEGHGGGSAGFRFRHLLPGPTGSVVWSTLVCVSQLA